MEIAAVEQERQTQNPVSFQTIKQKFKLLQAVIKCLVLLFYQPHLKRNMTDNNIYIEIVARMYHRSTVLPKLPFVLKWVAKFDFRKLNKAYVSRNTFWLQWKHSAALLHAGLRSNAYWHNRVFHKAHSMLSNLWYLFSYWDCIL